MTDPRRPRASVAKEAPPIGRAPSLPLPEPTRGGGYANTMMSGAGTQPIMTPGMTFGEVGNSGLRAFAGWVREEFLTELQGRSGAQKYREMGDSSPIIGAILATMHATMRKVEWRVEPSSDNGAGREMAEYVESLMDDMSHTWEDLISEALSMLQYGYAPHEIVYKRRLGRAPGVGQDGRPLPASKYDDGRIGWRRLPLRGQDTVLKWFFDENGGITGMTQLPWVGTMRDIPIEKMLLFRASSHKNNPEGRSILRSAYVPYYFAKRMQEQEAILGERMGGVPVVSVPMTMIEAANAGDPGAVASMTAFKQLAVNLRIDEQMGVVVPSDVYQGVNGPSAVKMFSLELLTPQGGRGTSMNFETTITRYNTNMLTATLADFLTMGHDTRGAQNLGETKMDLFFQAIEGFLNSQAAVFNRFALPRIWELNALNYDLMPEVKPDLAQRVNLDMLSNFVLRLSQAGMPLFPNDDLQSFLLDSAGLPDISDPRALQAAGISDDQLEIADQKDQVALDRQQQQAEQQAAAAVGGGKDDGKDGSDQPERNNLEKMILASLARRMNRMAGPKFGLTMKKHKHARR